MKKEVLVLFGVLLADVILVIEILYIFIKRAVSNKLISALFEKNDEKFEKIKNSFFAKFLSKFEILQIKFNVYRMIKDSAKTEETIKQLSEINLSKNQKKNIYPSLFYYYVDKNKLDEAKYYFNELNKFGVYKNKKDIEMTYDTYVLKGHRYLDTMLSKLKTVSKQERPTLERKIARAYENKKISAEAKKYYNLADQHLAELNTKRR